MKFFTKEETDSLISRNIDLNSIKKLDNTLIWYKKKVSCIDITITAKDIFNLSNLNDLIIEDFSIFGVPYTKILREITIAKLNSLMSRSNITYKFFAYRTLSQTPSKNLYSGTMYHYIFINKNSLKVYNLDNYYRILEVLTIPFENILSFVKDTFKYNNTTFFYEIIKYTDDIKETLIYLRVIDDTTTITSFDSFLKTLNLTPVSQNTQENLKNALSKRILYKKLLITLLLFLLIISLYISKL